MARFLSTDWLARGLGTRFLFGTLFVNLAGSFVLAVVVEFLAAKLSASMELRGFLAVGLLGTFTTCSSFSLDVANLYERGNLLTAGGYVGASVTLSILALFSGLWIARTLLV